MTSFDSHNKHGRWAFPSQCYAWEPEALKNQVSSKQTTLLVSEGVLLKPGFLGRASLKTKRMIRGITCSY